MSSDSAEIHGDREPAPKPLGELPPVEPPTAGFVLQLFVIPAVIVAVLIVVVALFGKLAESQRDPTRYIEAIRSGGEHVRWRKAHELANLILTEPELGKDPKLLGSIAQLLDEELAKPELDANLGQYLAAALGAFQIDHGQAPSGQSVYVLDTLAAALTSARPLPVRLAACESLARHIAHSAAALDASAKPLKALIEASRDPEPELRQRAVFALGFAAVPEAEAAVRAALEDGDRFVRFNAANALARRGDRACAAVLREMLSTADLAAILGGESPTETAHQIESIQTEALGALGKAVESGHAELIADVRPQLTELAKSDFAGVRVQAEALLRARP